MNLNINVVKVENGYTVGFQVFPDPIVVNGYSQPQQVQYKTFVAKNQKEIGSIVQESILPLMTK